MARTPSSGLSERLDREPAAPEATLPLCGSPAWKPWTVGLAFFGAVALALCGQAAVATVSGDSAAERLGVAIVLILVNVATVGVAVVLAGIHARPRAADFGLCRPRLGPAIGLLLAVWVALTVTTVLWVSALGLDGDDAQALTDRLGTDGTLTVVTLIVIVTILGPLGEEFLFRGYIFRALRNWRGVWPAAITTGVLFAATHIGWIPISFMVPVVLSGIGLCLLYHWTGSIYPGIALHALNNSIPLATALKWTWQTPLLMVCSTLAALTIAQLIALRLGDRSPPQTASPNR